MHASIDQDNCIQCGVCADTCPEVFRMSDDGPAEVYTDPIPEDVLDSATEAKDNCPVEVISIND